MAYISNPPVNGGTPSYNPQSLAATGGTPSYTWSVSAGAQPGGLTLGVAGALNGTPTAAGTFNFTAQLTDGAGVSASNAFAVTIVLADVNTNGLPDPWEIQYFNAGAPPQLDPDGEGISNLNEYLAGTIPTSNASKLQLDITSLTPAAGVFRFNTVTGRLYTVQYSDTLTGTWSTLGTANIPGTGGQIEVTDATPPTSRRFYRLQVTLP